MCVYVCVAEPAIKCLCKVMAIAYAPLAVNCTNKAGRYIPNEGVLATMPGTTTTGKDLLIDPLCTPWTSIPQSHETSI